MLVIYISECHVHYQIEVRMATCVWRMLFNPNVFEIIFSFTEYVKHRITLGIHKACKINNTFTFANLDT